MPAWQQQQLLLIQQAIWVCTVAVSSPPPLGDAPEPYEPLHGGAFTGAAAPLSPDPLATYQFGPGTNHTALQIFTVRPTAVAVLNGSCVGCATLASAAPSATVAAPMTILRLDFGRELPAWLEIDSPDYNSSTHAPITMGIGEYHTPWQSGGGSWKTGTPKQYGTTLRLETNPELYEGLRFGFVFVGDSRGAPFVPFTISTVRAVTQTKAVNYTGHFHAPTDALLEKVWWTAAWTVRANLLTKYFGSILMDRGDRESWTGDAHPAQATALVAFHNLDLIKQNLMLTEPVDNGIATYDMYWVLSVVDYHMYTGDTSILVLYETQLLQKLSRAIQEVANPKQGLRFVGWDDRTGAGFSNSSCEECERDFHFLTLRALNETADMMVTVNKTMAHNLKSSARALTATLRSPKVGSGSGSGPWYSSLLLASASDAVNSGITTPSEEAALYEAVFSDPINICQLSPFNTYWTLQALGRMGRHEQALFVLRKCYGGMIELGATTFWETFAHAPEFISGDLPSAMTDPGTAKPSFVPWTWSGITSLCHPWAAGPAYWMSQNLLGVTPTSPGFASFEIKPRLAWSLPSVAGTVPSVRGSFEVAFDLALPTTQRPHSSGARSAAGGGQARLSIPSACHGRLELALLPSQRLRPDTLRLNGALLNTKRAEASGQVSAVWSASSSTAIVVEGLTPGRHHIIWSTTQLSNTTSGTEAGRVDGAPPPLSAPYPKPEYRAKFLGRDDTTKGNWKGRYGRAGHLFFPAPPALPPPAPPTPPSTTCAVVGEAAPNTTNMKPLTCLTSQIARIVFADYGSITGDCQHGLSAAKCSLNLSLAVSAACVGQHSCALSCVQGGANRCTVNGHHLIVPSPDPCAGVGKKVGLQIVCADDSSTGGGPAIATASENTAANAEQAMTTARPGCNPQVSYCNASLPAFVSSVTNAYGRGRLHAFHDVILSDIRALEGVGDSDSRSIGQLSDTVIIAIDIAVKLSHTAHYLLAAYFVDWERQGRVNSVTLMNATGYTFTTIAPSQLLRDFGGGAWLVWNATGSVRLRVAHVGGDHTIPGGGGGADCPISALAFDL